MVDETLPEFAALDDDAPADAVPYEQPDPSPPDDEVPEEPEEDPEGLTDDGG